MTQKHELILDVAGVIATNFSPYFWRYLSNQAGTTYDAMDECKRGIREDLWTGKISEDEFWTLLSERFPAIKIENAQIVLLSYIKPLPAMKELPKWSEYANVHLLSNHRIEWINHILIPIQRYLTSVTISSQVGSCKPNPNIYAVVKEKLSNKENVLFVDDQEKNFREAKRIGWDTVMADEKGNWIHKIMPRLTNTSAK